MVMDKKGKLTFLLVLYVVRMEGPTRVEECPEEGYVFPSDSSGE
jgi:hypothetical protein